MAARILGTTSGQKRFATTSNLVAIARVHLTAVGSGLKTSLCSRHLPTGGKAAVREPAERRTENERELRRQLLQTFYNVRRTQPHRPSLPLRVIPRSLGLSTRRSSRCGISGGKSSLR